ncbi:FAD-dependent oxidoreductase [Brevibacterium sp. 50QC2O2]|uniref:FAD-dependent oxidoreductase n=1 Tax=Brevibacterium sp. 50QC2O2 TaxID=2968459 RepID=UPI00211CC063|nr:FAD-dependent oxidoreductase [Brevibacterium sp. 50QC2O2]MCQ9389817.1 FAD-dependent oxidoreductase [Brevibacterium sp. 50QC2O2]
MAGGGRVAVIGCGTMGTFAAWELAQSGAEVTVFERFGLGHEFGAYSGETRIYRRKYIEGPEYDELLAYSEDVWLKLDGESGGPLFTRTGVMSIGSETGHVISSLVSSQAALGFSPELQSADELESRMAGIAIESDYVGIEDASGGLLRPEAILALMWQKLAAAGVSVREWTPVSSLRTADDHVAVVLPDGSEETFEKVIVTVGAWSNDLLGGVIPRIDVQRLAVHWYPVRPGYDMSTIPVAVIDRGFDFCVWPSIDGVSIKVGLNLGVDRPKDLASIDKTMPAELVRFVDSLIAENVPGAYPRAIRQAVQLEGWNPDQRFTIGASTSSRRIVIGAGFSAHGFKMAPAVGKALAELAVGESSQFDLSPFSPSRFAVNRTIDEYVNGGFVRE